MTRIMTQAEARKITVQLLWEHGLFDWKVKFDQAKTRTGRCDFGERTIQLSDYNLKLRPYEASLNTILHEVAHARVGVEVKYVRTSKGVQRRVEHHTDRWRKTFIAMGGNGQRCSTATPRETGRYKLVCPACDKVTWKHRKLKLNRSCGECNPRIYDERFKLVITDTKTGRQVLAGA